MNQIETMGYLGPQGTHSEEVALYLNAQRSEKSKRQLVPFGGFYEMMRAVQEARLDCCVVPVENSIEGSINITLDTLAHDVDLQVEREIVWMVHNSLMAKDPKARIDTIISHPQPLAQCRSYLATHYSAAEIRPVASTAKAAEIVADGANTLAAICSVRAGELYNLKIVAEDIQDNNTNCTRFFVLTRPQQSLVQGSDKTSLICQINGARAGSLCGVLMDFAAHNVNLLRIESRPARTGLGEYIFFLCLDAASDLPNVKAALESVAHKSLWLKNLGSFDVTCVDQKNIRQKEIL